MTENQVRLTIGALLHDVGKVIYRTGDGRNHSASGKDYLENEVGIKDNLVLESIAYHHGSNLKNAKIADDSYAYITYYADNIAASADRREKAEGEGGFDKKVPLASVFNILNGNSQNYHYSRQILDIENGINYPTEERVDLQEDFYKKIRQNLTDCLKQINYTEEYLNSLLAVLESNLSYIPSSTSKKEMEDISLYDHMKITAALAQCIEHYLVENQIKNYREKLMMKTEKLYDEKMFVLYSMDISGIQKFIYTINSEGALRSLRARSFYLEIMMEHIIDELLEQLSLSRANLIYSGGGHCYLLVPNTVQSKKIIQRKEEETNQWLLDTYGIALYVAGGYAECSANDLKNNPTGSYSELYRKVSRMISEKKSHRYGKKELIALNTQKTKGERECKVCRRIAAVSENGKCNICRNLEKMSGNILYENFFIVQSEIQEDALPLPGEKYLIADNEAGTKKRMETASYVRCYTKNRLFTGKRVATKLWVGDYTSQDTFEEFAQKAKGIDRIAVLRADVDNLGKTFMSGFVDKKGDDRYVTLSRTATLSRQLSLFFKYYISSILGDGEETRFGNTGKRNITIVYSGGDDVFLAGAWNDVIAAFIDLHKALERFSQGQIKISGGIEIYPAIDHIYPQSKTMDDSLKNRVLVKKEYNAKKSDTYPIAADIQKKMMPFWKSLLTGGFIPKEKYDRLIRNNPLDANELAGFIERQIVETRQSTKAGAEILKKILPDTEIVYVKAKTVSKFRQDFDFIKVRDMNDLHHAKDAYLNIVVGNVYFVKFTKNAAWFVKENPGRTYNLEKMFIWDVARDGEIAWKAGKSGSIVQVRAMMEKNHILVTRRSYEVKGGLFDQQILKKGKGQVPVKESDERLRDIGKYGGYNKAAGAYFMLVSHMKEV